MRLSVILAISGLLITLVACMPPPREVWYENTEVTDWYWLFHLKSGEHDTLILHRSEPAGSRHFFQNVLVMQVDPDLIRENHRIDIPGNGIRVMFIKDYSGSNSIYLLESTEDCTGSITFTRVEPEKAEASVDIRVPEYSWQLNDRVQFKKLERPSPLPAQPPPVPSDSTFTRAEALEMAKQFLIAGGLDDTYTPDPRWVMYDGYGYMILCRHKDSEDEAPRFGIILIEEETRKIRWDPL